MPSLVAALGNLADPAGADHRRGHAEPGTGPQATLNQRDQTVVHRAGGEWDSTLKVSDIIHVTASRDILAAMARGEGPEEAVVALGYAGWDGGQLEDEIRANAWLSAPVDPGLIFELPFESRWEAAGRLLGVELSRISPISGNA